MRMSDIPFGTTDWSAVEPEYFAGEQGQAIWRTRRFGPLDNAIRVRMVEYTPGYVSDHWCEKGHILLCLDGELETTLADGRVFLLRPVIPGRPAGPSPEPMNTGRVQWSAAPAAL
jgi:quercetin dioxygenase-like cupin family protein